jgi:hypothetical protein
VVRRVHGAGGDNGGTGEQGLCFGSVGE